MIKLVAPVPSPVAEIEKAMAEYSKRHAATPHGEPLPDPKALLVALEATVKDAHDRIADLVAERVEAGAAANETAKLVSELKNRLRTLETHLRLDPPSAELTEPPTAHIVDVGAALAQSSAPAPVAMPTCRQWRAVVVYGHPDLRNIVSNEPCGGLDFTPILDMVREGPHVALISAAPELFDACDEALDWLDNHADDPTDEGAVELRKMLRAAVAKARGGK